MLTQLTIYKFWINNGILMIPDVALHFNISEEQVHLAIDIYIDK